MLKAFTDTTASRVTKIKIPNTDYLRNLANELDHLSNIKEARPGDYVSKMIAQDLMIVCEVVREPIVQAKRDIENDIMPVERNAYPGDFTN